MSEEEIGNSGGKFNTYTKRHSAHEGQNVEITQSETGI